MRSLRAEISDDDSLQRLTREGIEVFLGEARFTGPDTIEVFDGKERQTLRFAKALIATGGRARDLAPARPGRGRLPDQRNPLPTDQAAATSRP